METSLSDSRERRLAELGSRLGGAWLRMLKRIPHAPRVLAQPAIWQAVGAGAMVCFLWMMMKRDLGSNVEFWPLLLTAGTGAVVFACLRRMLGLNAWFALPGAVMYLCHPLLNGGSPGIASGVALLPGLLAPLAFLLVWRICIAGSMRSGICLGMVLGTILALRLSDGLLLVAVAGCYGLFETLFDRSSKMPRILWRAGVTMVLVVAAIATFVASALPGVASGLGIPLSSSGAQAQTQAQVHASAPIPSIEGGTIAEGLSAESPIAISAPFALVDRGGLLAGRLGTLPDNLTTGGQYLGWMVIALSLVAVWPRRSSGDDRSLAAVLVARRVAAFVVLAMTLTWLCRGMGTGGGAASLHVQLVSLFEFATVRRYVEPTSLHLIGLMVVPLMVIALTLFVSAACLFAGGQRFTLPTIVVATIAVTLWWGTSPPTSLSQLGADSSGWYGSSILQAMLAFLLIGAMATGFHRLCMIARGRHWRAILWNSVLILLVVDLDGWTGSGVTGCSHPDETTVQAG